jgi:hypothetical protein
MDQPAREISRNIGCLKPVRSDQELAKYAELRGDASIDQVKAELDSLTQNSLGDLFLVKDKTGTVLTWARVADAGGRGVSLQHGLQEGEGTQALEAFVEDQRERRKFFAVTWEDESGKLHVDARRVEAKLASIAGLPLGGKIAEGGLRRGKTTEPPGDNQSSVSIKD